MSNKTVMWKTGHLRFRNEPLIIPVQVERVTDASVWINGRKRARVSSYERFHDTFALAKAHVQQKLERQLESTCDTLGRIKGDLLLLANESEPS